MKTVSTISLLHNLYGQMFVISVLYFDVLCLKKNYDYIAVTQIHFECSYLYFVCVCLII